MPTTLLVAPLLSDLPLALNTIESQIADPADIMKILDLMTESDWMTDFFNFTHSKNKKNLTLLWMLQKSYKMQYTTNKNAPSKWILTYYG
jgi:hypothetical protein